MEIFINCVKENYSNFEGRAKRKEFWLFCAFFAVITLALAFIMGFISGLTAVGAIKYLYMVFVLLMLCPFLAVAVRRFHDTNRSGKMLLIGLIPIVGIILVIIWLCGKTVDEKTIKMQNAKKKLNKK